MDQSSFVAQLNRLRAIRPRVWDEAEAAGREALSTELYRKYSRLAAEDWTRIVSHVIDRYDGRKGRELPELSDFSDAMRAVCQRSHGTSSEPITAEEIATRRAENLRWMEAQSLSMDPKGAKVTLDLERTSGVKLPKHIHAMLVEIVEAGETCLKPIPAVESVIDVAKRAAGDRE